MNLFPLDTPTEPDLYEGDLEADPVSESQARASRDGREFDEAAFEYLESCGARIIERYIRVVRYPLDALVEGANGARYFVDAHGTPDRTPRPQAGMRRQDTALKFGYKALYLASRREAQPLILVTSHMPTPELSSARILRELATADALWDAVAVNDFAGRRRLESYFWDTPAPAQPLSAPWRDGDQLSFDDDFDPDDWEEF
jgi:hypothetical protein